MARKAGQLISHGSHTWLVRVSLGRDPETGTRKYHNKTVYEALLRLHIRPSLGNKPLDAIGPLDIQTVYAQMFERGLSPRTIEYTNAVLRSAFRQAVRWKMLADDPCIHVDVPPVKPREMQALSVQECRHFLEVAKGSKWFAVFALALTTGMRPSEYLALKRSDIDWQRVLRVSAERFKCLVQAGNFTTRNARGVGGWSSFKISC